MSMDNEQFIPAEAHELQKQLDISVVDPGDRDSIADYYKFEINQGFGTVNQKTTFDKMVDFRKRQMDEGKLKVITAKEENQLIATSVVVLEKGTMGKDIGDEEAYAAGTLVLPDKRSGGIGEKMAAEQ